MSAQAEVPKGTSLRDAWETYKASEDYENSRRWAAHDEHRDGSMWAAFAEGWRLATERAANIHEIVNPASARLAITAHVEGWQPKPAKE